MLEIVVQMRVSFLESNGSNVQIGLFLVSGYRIPDPTLKLGLAHHSVSPLATIERGAARVRIELSALWVRWQATCLVVESTHLAVH